MKQRLHPLVNISLRGKTVLRRRNFANFHVLPPTPLFFTTGTPHGSRRFSKYLGAGVYIALGIPALFIFTSIIHAEAPPNEDGEPRARQIRLSEVKQHGRNAETQWITKGTRVYDITEWIPGHPGGEVILRAVGGAVDSYWNIFTIHKKQEVYDILESYYIGDVDSTDLVDGQVPVDHIDDPFENDPARDERLMIHSQRPCNAETPTTELLKFVTPNETFYVRNHMWVPETSLKGHTITIELPNGQERIYTIQDLKDNFQEVSITATLQCSGNRRKHMTEESRSADGLPWSVGGISNAVWTGVRLRDILKDTGFPIDDLPDDAKHAQFVGAEAYGASIPIDKAVDKRGDVLLAYQMNGQSLPHDHGFPVRVIVPGTVAARSVKWVNRVVVSEEESPSQWQQRDYKCFGPNVGGNPDWSTAPAIQDMPVQSAITSLRDISSQFTQERDLLQVNEREEDVVAVEGYAFAGGGRSIVRVDLSTDGGRSWHQAELLKDLDEGEGGHKAWAWTRWRSVVPRHMAGGCFVVKAVDEAYNTQPGEYEPCYNFRGNLTSSWHKVTYEPSAGSEA